MYVQAAIQQSQEALSSVHGAPWKLPVLEQIQRQPPHSFFISAPLNQLSCHAEPSCNFASLAGVFALGSIDRVRFLLFATSLLIHAKYAGLQLNALRLPLSNLAARQHSSDSGVQVPSRLYSTQ